MQYVFSSSGDCIQDTMPGVMQSEHNTKTKDDTME